MGPRPGGGEELPSWVHLTQVTVRNTGTGLGIGENKGSPTLRKL